LVIIPVVESTDVNVLHITNYIN